MHTLHVNLQDFLTVRDERTVVISEGNRACHDTGRVHRLRDRHVKKPVVVVEYFGILFPSRCLVCLKLLLILALALPAQGFLAKILSFSSLSFVYSLENCLISSARGMSFMRLGKRRLPASSKKYRLNPSRTSPKRSSRSHL